jgi:membrane protein implicated in regulation of membrane protease activity
MTPTGRHINAFFASLTALLLAVLLAFALLTGHVAWWLSAAASAVLVWTMFRRLRSGDERGDRSANSSAG